MKLLKPLLKEQTFVKGEEYFKYGNQAMQIIKTYTPMIYGSMGQTERVKLFFSKKDRKWMVNLEQFNYKNSSWQTVKTIIPFSNIMDTRGWDKDDE